MPWTGCGLILLDLGSSSGSWGFVEQIFLPKQKMSFAVRVEQEAGQAAPAAGRARGLRAPVADGR